MNIQNKQLREPSGRKAPPCPKESPDPKEPNAADRYEIYRKYIQHEDNLINNRVTWMLSIHGFLYATYGFTLQKLLEVNEKISQFLGSKTPWPDHAEAIDCYLNEYTLGVSLSQLFFFLYCICLIGFTISVVSLLSIRGAYKATMALVDIFDFQYRPKSLDVPYNDTLFSSASSWTSYPGRLSKLLYRIGFFPKAGDHLSGRCYNDASRPRDKERSRKIMYYDVFSKTEFKLPLLTGGGYRGGAVKGFAVAQTMPIILMLSWIVSGSFAVYDQNKTSKLFEKRGECALIETSARRQRFVEDNLTSKGINPPFPLTLPDYER